MLIPTSIHTVPTWRSFRRNVAASGSCISAACSAVRPISRGGQILLASLIQRLCKPRIFISLASYDKVTDSLRRNETKRKRNENDIPCCDWSAAQLFFFSTSHSEVHRFRFRFDAFRRRLSVTLSYDVAGNICWTVPPTVNRPASARRSSTRQYPGQCSWSWNPAK